MPDDQAKHSDAKTIATDLLDTTGKALIAGDFISFAAVFALPHVMTTDEESFTIRSMEELRALFRNVTTHFAQEGVTRLDRRIEVAEFLNPTKISSTHITRKMKDHMQVGPETPTHSILELIDGTWKVTSANYANGSSTGQIMALSPSRASQIAARNIYQAFVDQLSQAMLSQNPDKLVPLISLPLHVCLLYTSPSPRDQRGARMPSSA